MLRKSALLLQTLLVALSGGLMFHLLHIPLAWMLGPVVASMLWKLGLKREAWWPSQLRNIGLIILGFLMGASFTVETGIQILEQLPTMMLATFSTILFSFLTAYMTYRGTGISLSTSVLGSIPGGLNQMLALAEEIPQTDITIVTFMQTIRLLAVVFLVPFTVVHGFTGNSAKTGTLDPAVALPTALTPETAIMFILVISFSLWLALKIKLPTPYLLGPLLGVIVLVVAGNAAPALPSFMAVVAQICIGTYIGLEIKLASLSNWQRVLTYSVAGGLGIVAFSLVIGFLLSVLHGLTIVDAFLGTSPGGMAEMGLTAISVNADLSIITAYQMFRLLFILFIVPPLLKWWLSGKRGKEIVRDS